MSREEQAKALQDEKEKLENMGQKLMSNANPPSTGKRGDYYVDEHGNKDILQSYDEGESKTLWQMEQKRKR